jgi:hypothetical protein
MNDSNIRVKVLKFGENFVYEWLYEWRNFQS